MFLKYLETITDIFFPRICAGCGKFGKFICSDCSYKMVEEEFICHVCKRDLKTTQFVHSYCKKKTNLDGVFVAYKYDKKVEHIIAEIKYENHFSIIGDLAKLYTYIFETPRWKKINRQDLVFIPVPIDYFRQNERGFNQSVEICRKFSKYKYKPLLKKRLFTKHQVGLTKYERLQNIKGSFYLDKKLKDDITQRTFVIVDDVMTSGATLEECAKVMKQNYPKSKVYGLVFARG